VSAVETIGVDLGGSKMRVAVVDGEQRVLHHSTEGSRGRSEDEVLATLERELVEARDARPGVTAAGLGIPCTIDQERGIAIAAVNLPLIDVPIRDMMRERLGLPVFIDNDVNAAILAEHRFGAARGARNAVMIALGTGIGGGMILGGRVYRGTHGAGAELGHMVVDIDGPPCQGNCPNHGCIEAYCSGQALERDATELATDKPDSRLAHSLGDDGKVSGRAVVQAAEDGDPDALFIFENFARMLGIALAGYVNVFQPERLTIGGGLSRAGHLFLDRAIQEADNRALPALLRRTTIALAQGGTNAGMIGAAVLAAQEVEAQNRDTPRTHATTTERAE
jgi:glucokinase